MRPGVSEIGPGTGRMKTARAGSAGRLPAMTTTLTGPAGGHAGTTTDGLARDRRSWHNPGIAARHGGRNLDRLVFLAKAPRPHGPGSVHTSRQAHGGGRRGRPPPVQRSHLGRTPQAASRSHVAALGDDAGLNQSGPGYSAM